MMIAMPPGSAAAIAKTALAIRNQPARQLALLEELYLQTSLPPSDAVAKLYEALTDELACVDEAERRAAIKGLVSMFLDGLSDEAADEMEAEIARDEGRLQ